MNNCNCKKADAWRCAVDQGLSSVSCHCDCHRHKQALTDEQVLAWGERSDIERPLSTLRCMIDDARTIEFAHTKE